jgi:hypothetical protein
LIPIGIVLWKSARNEIDPTLGQLPKALELSARSFLPSPLLEKYQEILVRNTTVLRGESIDPGRA